MELYNGRPEDTSGRKEKEIKVYDILDSLHIPYIRADHEAVMTMEACEEIDKALGMEICKNLFLCNRKKTSYYLLLMPGNKALKTKELSQQIPTTRLSFASGEDMETYLNVTPSEQELDYMSLENHVTKDTPPCFLWQTVTDQTVPVENSYLFAQACAQAGVPFAQHVFSEGIHGLSVATEEWLEQNIGQEEGKRYTQEQVQMLAEAIEAGETPFPKEKGEELLVKFGIGRKKPARWTEKQKEGIRKTLKEVQSWTQLAEVWMEKYLKVE